MKYFIDVDTFTNEKNYGELCAKFENLYEKNPNLKFYGLKYVKSRPKIIAIFNLDLSNEHKEDIFVIKTINEYISVYDDDEGELV